MRTLVRWFIAPLFFSGLHAEAVQAQVPPHTDVPPASDTLVFGSSGAEVVLSLEDAIGVALEGSFEIHRLQEGYLRSNLSLEAFQRALGTHIDLQATLPSVNQNIRPELVGTDLEFIRNSDAFGRVGLALSKPLITNGEIGLVTSFSAFESFQELPVGETRSRSVRPSLGIRFSQPLFQYNEARGLLKEAELSFESIDLSYAEDELALVNRVTGQFYELFRQQREVQIAAERHQQSRANTETGIRRYQAGQILEVEYLNLTLRESADEAALESARNRHQETRFAFNRLVGIPLETEVRVEAELDYVPVEVDRDRALELALENRSDVRQAEIGLEQSHLNLEEVVARGRPRLELILGYEVTGNSAILLDAQNAWDQHLRRAFDPDTRAPNANVSLSLALPLFDSGVNRANVARETSRIREQERGLAEVQEDLKQAVLNQVNALQSALRRLEIQEQSVRVARASYEITRARYERGEITFEQLSQSQDMVTQSERQYLSDWITYQMAKVDLRALTLWDWERDLPVLPRTTPPTPYSGERAVMR